MKAETDNTNQTNSKPQPQSKVEECNHNHKADKNQEQKQQINSNGKDMKSENTQANKSKEDQPKQKKQKEYDEEIPDKFYDSDLASVNQKDFMSENQPPKDIQHERKLLHKQKKLHIYKTIVKVGKGIDKPAPYDQIKLRFRQQTNVDSEGLAEAKKTDFVENQQFIIYNLGLRHQQIERLVTSMKQGQTALFQVQQLEVSKKTNIKVLKQKHIYVVEVQKWTTVIDIDGNKQILKYLLRRGQGPHRVSKYDQVSYQLQIKYKNKQIFLESTNQLKIEQETINKMQPIVWKILTTMKKNQIAKVCLDDENMRAVSAIWKEDQNKELQPDLTKYDELIKLCEQSQTKTQTSDKKQMESQNEKDKHKIGLTQKNSLIQRKQWQVNIEIKQLISIDDIFMDGTIFKKLMVKGVSTAKPQSSSIIYYALKFLDSKKNVLYEDPCFNSDWWEDFSKLDGLKCRKNYLDEYKMSKFLKVAMKRMKPAEISLIQCRNLDCFKYGQDFDELKKLWPENEDFPPKKVYMIVRVYNFTQGKNCFNMQINEKVEESRRKKKVAVKLLNEGKIQKALKTFQKIVSFYNSGDINQQGYDEKISALMNSILCLMKQKKHSQMIPLCDKVLQKPKHGFDQNKMSIKAQGIKVQGNVSQNTKDQMDCRLASDLVQNNTIIDKCLYRKALALLNIGQSKQSLQCLSKIQNQTQQTNSLKAEAQKHLQNYEQKTKKIFQSMFKF